MTPGLRIGKYEVGARLGKGSFGVVHLARDVELGREVAIKFLRPEFSMRDQMVQRFLQEARAAAKIGHPGIVTVFECGLISGTSSKTDGTAYIVMERLLGDSLGDKIAAKTTFTYGAIVAIGRQLATALQAAHAAGIIHRDLKPDNVFLVPDAAVVGGERVKILDFGIAKLDDPGPSGMHTHSKMILGTPRYMSPEQARSSTNIDARSDIYGLGCMLYELICGRAPFEGDSGDIMFQHQTAEVPPASSLIGNVPEPLDTLLRAMLQKQPDKRPATMQAIDAALATVKDDARPAARSKAKFVEQPVITAVVEPPRPKRISAAGELTTASPGTQDQRVEIHQVEVDMDADVTDLEQPLLRRAKSEPSPTPSEEHTAPTRRQLPLVELLERPVDDTRAPHLMNERATISINERRVLSTNGHAETADARTARDLETIGQPTLSTRRREIPRQVWFAAGGVGVLILMIVVIARCGSGPTIPDPTIAPQPPTLPGTVDAQRAPDPQEKRAWIESECKVAQTDRNWVALERCGHALSELDARAGEALVGLANTEALAEARLRMIREAETTGDLARAIELATNFPESVYRADVGEALRRTKVAFLAQQMTILDDHATAHDCAAYTDALAAIEIRNGRPIREEIEAAAKPCKPRTRTAKAGDGTVRDEPDPPPDEKRCDRALVDAIEVKAEAALNGGSYAIALSTFETILECKPSVLTKTYLAACRSRNFAKAKTLFSRIGRESLAQVCMKEGYDPRQ